MDMRRDSSVVIATGYGRGSIPGRGKRFFCTLQRPDQLWISPSLLYNGQLFPRGQSSRGVKLITHIRLVPRPSMVDLYIHSPICLRGVVLF
jgi:hypothetical protein